MPKNRKTEQAQGPGPDELYILTAEDELMIQHSFGRLSSRRKEQVEAKLKTSRSLRDIREMIGLFRKEYPTTSINIFRVRVILAMTDLNWATARQERQRKELRSANPEYMKGRKPVLDTVVGPHMRLLHFNPWVEMLIDLHYGLLSSEAERKAKALLRSSAAHLLLMGNIIKFHERCGPRSAAQHKKGLVNMVGHAAGMMRTIDELLGHN